MSFLRVSLVPDAQPDCHMGGTCGGLALIDFGEVSIHVPGETMREKGHWVADLIERLNGLSDRIYAAEMGHDAGQADAERVASERGAS